MVNQKSNYSENENANGKMSNNGKRIEASNQHTSELHHRSDDCKDFNEKRCMKCIRTGAKLGLFIFSLYLENVTSLEKKASSKTRQKLLSGIKKPLSRTCLKQSVNLDACTYSAKASKKTGKKQRNGFSELLPMERMMPLKSCMRQTNK